MLAAERTLMIFFRTGGVWATRERLFIGVSPLLRGVLGGKFSSNSSGLRWPPKETRLLFKGFPSVLPKGMKTNGKGDEKTTLVLVPCFQLILKSDQRFLMPDYFTLWWCRES